MPTLPLVADLQGRTSIVLGPRAGHRTARVHACAIAKLDETLRLLRQAVREADFIETLMERFSKTLYRASKTLGIAPISLYTCRHQFIANAKGFMTRQEIAALIGHVSVDTASRHYERRAGD